MRHTHHNNYEKHHHSHEDHDMSQLPRGMKTALLITLAAIFAGSAAYTSCTQDKAQALDASPAPVLTVITP